MGEGTKQVSGDGRWRRLCDRSVLGASGLGVKGLRRLVFPPVKVTVGCPCPSVKKDQEHLSLLCLFRVPTREVGATRWR